MASDGFMKCYKCTERRELCHATCSAYLAAKAENEARKKADRLEKGIDAIQHESRRRYVRASGGKINIK